jgi:hypothetical protein
MSRKVLRLLTALLMLGSLDGLATAQAPLFGSQVGGGLAGAGAVTAPAQPGPSAAHSSEPGHLTGLLSAQNDVRVRAGLQALAWSGDLASRAEAVAKAAGKGTCAMSLAQRVGKAERASIYWAPGLRTSLGTGAPQDISMSYLVSRWREGQAGYDKESGQCRKGAGAYCEPYSRMVASKAKSVGCARAICPNQAQVWACLYSE